MTVRVRKEGSKGLRLGILLSLLLLLLVSWELAFLNIFVTAFLRLVIFPVWRLFLTKNLLSILLVAHGCLNNFFPRSIQGIPPTIFMISFTVSNKSFSSYLSLRNNLFTLSCETFSNISANLQHPRCFSYDSKSRV